jgi:hypothetical protein
MEWSIPLQKLEVGKVQIGEIIHNDKSIVPIAYFDGQNNFSNLNILLPMIHVKEFDQNSGKLLLDLNEHPHHQAKMNALQSTLLSAVFIQQKHWFHGYNYTFDILQQLFKPIVEDGLLQLYYPVQKADNLIKIYKKGIWYSKLIPGLLQTNDSVRIMFRIQGICFHKNQYNDNWSGKFRLQHRIYAILIN